MDSNEYFTSFLMSEKGAIELTENLQLFLIRIKTSTAHLFTKKSNKQLQRANNHKRHTHQTHLWHLNYIIAVAQTRGRKTTVDEYSTHELMNWQSAKVEDQVHVG